MPRAFVLVALLLLPTSAAPGAGESAITPTGGANLEALGRLLALVRFFHPSDQAVGVDWNRFTAAAIERVEAAPDSVALAALLQGLVKPIAPTVQVFPAGRAPELPAALLPPDNVHARMLAWRHYGVAFEERRPWSSERIDNLGSAGFAQLSQTVAATAFAGRRVQFSAQARARLEPGATAELWLRVERGEGQPSRLERMAGGTIDGEAWRRYEVVTEIEPDARSLSLGLLLAGAGRVWVDEAELERSGTGLGAAGLANADFEAGEVGRQPPGWVFPYSSIRAGYRLALRDGDICLAGRCAEVGSSPIANPRLEAPASVVTTSLGAGIEARVPSSLWADSRGTLSHQSRSPPSPVQPTPRAEGLAAVLLAWGALRHFYPYFEEVGVDWEAVLPESIERMAAAASPPERLAALRRLVAALGDAHASVSLKGAPELASLALDWEWIEDRLMVTAVADRDSPLRVGDEVTALNGRPTAERLAELEAQVGAPTAAGRRARATEELRFGPRGSRATVEVSRQAPDRSGEMRLAAELSYQHSYEDLRPAAGEADSEPAPGLLYLDLRRLTDADLPRLLPRLEKARGLVLDLRGQSEMSKALLSHLVRAPVSSAVWNIPVRLRPAPSPPDYLTTLWDLVPSQPLIAAKVAFLLDERSWGYSETLLSLVEGHRLGALVGSPSPGSNGSINRLPLPGGLSVVFTGMKVTRRDGSRFHGLGIRPTVPAHRTMAGLRAGRDEVIEAGLDEVR